MSELFDARGRRLYLTREERELVLAAAERGERRTRTFCLTLAYTGCRISEALELTAGAGRAPRTHTRGTSLLALGMFANP